MEKGNQELLQAITDHFDKRFDAIDKRLDEHDKRFDAIDKRLDGIDKRLDTHDHRFESVEMRLDRIDKRLDEHDDKFDKIVNGVARVMESQTKISLIIENEIRNDINMTNHTVRVLASSVQNLTEYFLHVNDLDVRTNKLESDMRDCQYRLEKIAS